MMGISPVLQVIDIWKSFDKLEVLKGISFDVSEGEVKVIFGPSGSGKSTLLRCINMLDPPHIGDILLRGESLVNPSTDLNKLRSRIGMVFQNFNLFAHLRAIDNVAIGPQKVLGLSKEEARNRADAALEMVKMTDRAHH